MPLDVYLFVFAAHAGDRLRILLEEKHLYQKVTLEPQQIVQSPGLQTVRADIRVKYEREFEEALQGAFALIDNPAPQGLPANQLSLPVKNIKIYCATCQAREAFRPIFCRDITDDWYKKWAALKAVGAESFKITFPKFLQLFLLSFQCQRCEGGPTAFLVKRNGTDLSLEGRSPIEHVELEAFIPKPELKWFRDAVIAFQTGKILAALFYMRTFIEQFARRKTGTLQDKRTGDQILTAYAELIPENIRSTMPSLREWYEKLSASIHAAQEDEQLFKDARAEVERHFDIRRVHRLDTVEKPAQISDSDDGSTQPNLETDEKSQHLIPDAPTTI